MVTIGDDRQQQVIERARTLIPADERILAVYLIGSYGTGSADRFSDVDSTVSSPTRHWSGSWRTGTTYCGRSPDQPC
ncbi:hypothetical protein GCM10009789_37030 [Kribbella sancticallisti]|uniref:Polymerase nucleotidyl transferase domain-containing protein n=1 Tax=Kribbella sancticallisti TaxID=460087 RepID=A0ABN2DLB8_9ACTN